MFEVRQTLTTGEADDLAGPCVNDLVRAQAASTPGAVAVEGETGAITYRQLDASAHRLAQQLMRRGVGPDVPVALMADRSPRLVVGLLGILEAGGAYLPLDPADPGDRIAYILESAGPQLVLAERRVADSIPKTDLPVVWLDDEDVDAPGGEAPPHPAANPADLVCIIYTSGSTGRPKGVEVTHGGLVNFLRSMRRATGIGPGDVVAALNTITFDIIGLDIWLPLTSGARVMMIGRDDAADGRRLARLLNGGGVTLAPATPATWRILLESGWEGGPGLTVVCGGEEMTRDLANRLLPRCKALWNIYGPTETTVCSLIHKVTPGTGPVPIGRPIDNTSAHLLDERLQPVADGREGELYLGGAGVARGYRNRPDLTNERFIPDPFSSEPGARLYRTGDLVQSLPDGSMVFRGRLDQQLKIRGYRVEAGEVESALLADPSVGQAVVVGAEGPDGSKRLVAHLVPHDGATLDREALRARLRRTLPKYMVPSQMSVHRAFPMTASGKVDRRVLASTPVANEPEEYVAPRNETERRLSRIWEDVLEVKPVGVTADFFALGGHSLLAAVLFSQIAREFGRELPVATLVDAPTVEAIARRLAEPAVTPWTPLVPIRTGGTGLPLFFVHGGGGTVLFLRDLAAGLDPGRPVYGLQSEGQDGRRMEAWRVEQMAARYIDAIRAVQPRGPFLIGGFCFGGIVAFEMARQLRDQGEEVEKVVLVNAPNASIPARQIEARPRRQEPPAGTAGSAASQAAGRIGRLRSSLAGTAVSRRPAYLASRVAAGLRWRWRHFATAASRPATHGAVRVAHALLSLGWRLPSSWRPTYLNTMTERSGSVYRPRPFDGSLHVIRGAGLFSDPALGWGGLARSITTIEVGGPQRLRRQLVTPPLVWDLAPLVGRLLNDDGDFKT